LKRHFCEYALPSSDGLSGFCCYQVVIAPARNAGASVKESTNTVKWRKMINIYHQPKKLEIIELKLEGKKIKAET
jgi:hypothetical protein